MRVLIFVLVALAIVNTSAFAVDTEVVSTVPLARDLPPLPLADEDEFFVHSSNAALFHDVLLAPIATWLKEGKFIVRVVRRLNFVWELSRDWERDSRNAVGDFSLDEAGTLRPGPVLDRLPFGRAGELVTEEDEQLATRILWNVAVSEAALGDIYYGVELAWIGPKSLLRKANGSYYRQYFPVEPYQKKEFLQLFSPSVVFGFAFVAHRFWGVEEDNVWIHSPVIGQNRSVLGANRTDGLLGSSLSFDDIFVWSDKVQNLNARVVDQKVLLVPFPSVDLYQLVEKRVYASSEVSEKAESVLSVQPLIARAENEEAAVRWNYEVGRFPRAVPWLPVSVFFVPRRVWIIEATTRDPYSNCGRQVLVVDQEMMLPVYKIVYDQRGDYLKTVVGGWGLAAYQDRRVPFSAFVLSVEQGDKPVTALSTTNARTFLGEKSKRADELRALFDISEHGKEIEATEEG